MQRSQELGHRQEKSNIQHRCPKKVHNDGRRYLKTERCLLEQAIRDDSKSNLSIQ